ncbi:MAG: tRNA-guanine transglycosylase, partial [Deltaproteobacteria bacterium]|nr:tRNA-guanine transglycosylase [Deltaproteobacteria bacterium]
MEFALEHTDQNTAARACRLALAHGVVETPVFMPVGTQGVVKALTARQLEELDARIILGNTYHLFLRPGSELIGNAGGLHRLTGWSGPILTDSGGYQVYSLARLRKLNDTGVTFQSHIDGTTFTFTPEQVVGIQEGFGVDIMMQLDECPPADAPKQQIEAAVDRSAVWAQRSCDAWSREASELFAIVQGGLHVDLRQKSAELLAGLELPG